jgi:hypothetical protein
LLNPRCAPGRFTYLPRAGLIEDAADASLAAALPGTAPITSSSTRRFGCRQVTSAGVFRVPGQSITGLVLPTPDVLIKGSSTPARTIKSRTVFALSSDRRAGRANLNTA